MAAWPTTVTSSRWPRAFVLRTQKPFSGLWKVTRSTSPARTSRSEISACRPAPGFTAFWGRERSAEPSPAVPDRPPRQDPETCPERHRQLPTRQLRAAPSGPHAGPSPSSTTSPYDKVPAWLPTVTTLARLAYGSAGMGRGCLFAIRNSRTATGARAPLPSSSRQRPIARLVVRGSSPRNPSSRSKMRLPCAVPITTSYQHRAAARGAGRRARARRSSSQSGSRPPPRCTASVRLHLRTKTGCFPREPSPPGAAHPRTRSGVRPRSPRRPRRSWSTRVRSRSRPAPEARRNRVRRAPRCRSPP